MDDVAQRFPGPESRRGDARRRDQADHPRAMPAVRLEELEPALVGGTRRALERVSDRVRQVVVADRNRVRVAERHHGYLGGGPGPDTREREHPAIGAGESHGEDLLESFCAPGGAADPLAAATLAADAAA